MTLGAVRCMGPAMSKLYKDAGVDIAAGDALVEAIGPAAARTRRPGVMAGLGGFGALFDPRAAGYDDPVLVAATDGVGQDLVAMCVNDLVCQGAEPLFFLDYLATGRLEVGAAARVVEGIAAACEAAGCALIGGETAEMPGMYAEGDLDLAGFAVGALERGTQLPAGVEDGDALLGLASDGVHSNGFSLVRRIAADAGLGWGDPSPFGGGTLGEALLTPTRLYVRSVLDAMRAGGLRAAAHVTGGGIDGNLPRVLPDGLGAVIDADWPRPPVFGWLAEAGGVPEEEMRQAFNCGLGMILVVSADRADALAAQLAGAGETVTHIGRIEQGRGVRYA